MLSINDKLIYVIIMYNSVVGRINGFGCTQIHADAFSTTCVVDWIIAYFATLTSFFQNKEIFTQLDELEKLDKTSGA